MKKTFIVVLLTFITIFGLAGCSNMNEKETEADSTSQKETSEKTSGPAAIVNGEEISRSDFKRQYERMKQQYEQFGMDVEENKEQIKQTVIDQMIGAELLSQKAAEAGIEISPEDVNKRYKAWTKQYKSKEQLKKALTDNDTTEEKLKEQVELQMKVNQYIESKTEDPVITEDELKEEYNALKEKQEDVGSFEAMKPTLEEQLKSQKKSEQVAALVEDLRKKADVQVHI